MNKLTISFLCVLESENMQVALYGLLFGLLGFLRGLRYETHEYTHVNILKVLLLSVMGSPKQYKESQIKITGKETENVDINSISTKGASEISNKKEF